MGHRSPILGYNHNVGYRGLVFHVQTEDSGVNNPHIFTHLFHGGVIISTRRLDYDAGAADDVVKSLMQAQHKAVLKELRRGMFDDKIDAFLSGNPELLPRPSRRDRENEPGAAVSADDSATGGAASSSPPPSAASLAGAPTPGESEPASAPGKQQGPGATPENENEVEIEVQAGDTFEEVIDLQAQLKDEAASREPDPAGSVKAVRDTLEVPAMTSLDELEESEVAVAFRSIMTEDEGSPQTPGLRRPATSPGLVVPSPRMGTAPPRPVKPAPPPLPSSTTSAAAGLGKADNAPAARGEETAKKPISPRPPQPTIRGTPIKPPPPPVIKARAVGAPARAPSPSLAPPSPPSDRAVPAKPAPRPGGVVISRPPIIVESRQAKGSRPAPAARPSRVPPARKVREEKPDGLFDQNLISEKSLDEVILAYLSEDSSEED